MRSALIGALALLAACAPKTTPENNAPEDKAAPADASAIPAGDYALDKSHASLVFRVNHIGFSMYTASFADFDAALRLDPKNPGAASVTARIDPASLTLPAPPEGFKATLLGPDWLDAGAYPEISFRSTDIDVTAPNAATVKGELTLHGQTKPVSFEAVYNGGYKGLAQYDPRARVGFSAHGTLKRSDFGVSLGIPEPGSTMGVFDDVSFAIEAEFMGPPLAPEE
ncbi:MAG: YceI family protein [Amphiplicatus sp.]